MGRISQIDQAHLYEVIGKVMLEDGTISMQNIASKSGVSIGSLYHRFSSREHMLVHAWVDALGAFQEVFIAAMGGSFEDVGQEAALVTPRFCREHHGRAIILACCQQTQFVGKSIEDHMLAECHNRNVEMAKLIKTYARRSSKSLDACYLGIVHYPLAVVRNFLPGRKIPKHADDHVVAAFRAAMITAL